VELLAAHAGEAMMMDTVSFIRSEDGTADEYRMLAARATAFHKEHTANNVLACFRSLKGISLGLQIDYVTHGLQTATRAYRDGARIDLVVAALLHDIGDSLAPFNHSEFAAAVLAPFLDEEAVWIVRHHAVFQGYHFWDKLGLNPDSREQYRGHPYFDSTAHFCAAWDQTSFDPDYDTLPLEFFEPMVREVFARTAPIIRDGKGAKVDGR
jgi:predicted HD phosphohydrolase